MADWRKRARISGDVVLFDYVTSNLEKNASHVYVWDIDKTYLDTHFETLKELWRTAIEKAFQKRNVPGTGSLVRAIIKSRGEESVPFPLYFVSASPPQMEKKIKAKLEIDSVNPYGIFFKDNLKNLKPKRLWRLNKQVGFKLQALLELRLRLSDGVKQILWGDDSESDVEVYNIYSDICAKRLTESELKQVLERHHVVDRQLDYIFELQDKMPSHDPVERIYINLANDTDPDYYTKFGRRTLATFDTFQAALDLYNYDRINADSVIRVAQDMIMNYGFTKDELANSFEELLDRKVIGKPVVETIVPLAKKHSVLPNSFDPLFTENDDRVVQDQSPQSWRPEFIDYLTDFR